MNQVTGIVLAAGLSRRLGRPKQLLILEGMPLIAHVVDRALASSLDDVLVVTGAHEEKVHAALADRPVRFVHNSRYEEGQGTSLALGIIALDADVDAAVILLADQPGISSAAIDRVLAAHRETKTAVVMAEYGEQRGHPVLFGRETFSRLVTLDGDMGGREIIRSYGDAVAMVDGGACALPPDVDTEEAWEDLQRSWRALREPAPPDP